MSGLTASDPWHERNLNVGDRNFNAALLVSNGSPDSGHPNACSTTIHGSAVQPTQGFLVVSLQTVISASL